MRAPCSAIDIMIENVLNTKGLKNKYIKILKPVLYASSMLKCQINNQLDYNLILAKKFKLKKQKVDIRTVVTDLVEIMEI